MHMHGIWKIVESVPDNLFSTLLILKNSNYQCRDTIYIYLSFVVFADILILIFTLQLNSNLIVAATFPI